MPMRPDSEEIQTQFLMQSLRLGSADLLCFYVQIIENLRFEGVVALKFSIQEIQQIRQQWNFSTAWESSQWLLSLAPFFKKELKSVAEKQKSDLIENLCQRFFWQRIPLWKWEDESLIFHADWIYFWQKHGIMLREILLTRLLEIGYFPDWEQMRSYQYQRKTVYETR